MLKKLFFLCSIILVFSIYKFPILIADTSTSATVPPRQSDFQFTLSSDDSGNNFPEQQTLTYTITYGAKESEGFPNNLTIVAEFTQDTINGIHVLDYVTGSATNTYQGSAPIIDLINRTITWHISQIKPNTLDQVLSFKLHTNSNYSGSTPVNFSVKALMSSAYFSFPEQNIYQTLNTQITPKTGSTTTSVSPTPMTTPTPTPTIYPQAQSGTAITDIFFNSILDKQGEMSVHTSLPSKISVFYGTAANALAQAFAAGDFATLTKAYLTGLKPNTTYYARVTAVDQSGNKDTSEIFIFHTAATPPVANVDKSTAILTSNGSLLSTITQGLSEHANIQTILPNSAPYEITYSLPPSSSVNYIDVVLRNKHVLGINTYAFAQESNVVLIPMAEKEQGVYFAKLPPILLPGEYEVYVRVAETTGNIYEQKVSEIKVSTPLTIRERGTNKPIDDARVYYFFYNNQSKRFEPITESFGSVKNPDFSNKNGRVDTVLPKGRYRIEVGGLFHTSITQEFTIGDGKSYPIIYLEKQPFNVIEFIKYGGNTFFDFGLNVEQYVAGLSTSNRYFNVLAVIILSISVFLSFLFFSFRSLTPLTRLPVLLYHHLHHTIFSSKQEIVYGKVMSVVGLPISQAVVYLVDANEKILSQIPTNRQGIFTYRKLQGIYTHLHIIKEGYEELHTPESEENNATYIVVENPDVALTIRKGVFRGIQTLFGFSFEVVLGLSVLLEIAFLIHFGIFPTLPFFILSLGNILLWLFYTKQTVKTHLERRIGIR